MILIGRGLDLTQVLVWKHTKNEINWNGQIRESFDVQLSGCTERCKAGNSLKNGAKAKGSTRKRKEKGSRADERKRSGTEKKRKGEERSKGSGRKKAERAKRSK